MKEEQSNEPKPLSPAIRARMEKSYFGLVILRGNEPFKMKEEDNGNAKTSDTVLVRE